MVFRRALLPDEPLFYCVGEQKELCPLLVVTSQSRLGFEVRNRTNYRASRVGFEV